MKVRAVAAVTAHGLTLAEKEVEEEGVVAAAVRVHPALVAAPAAPDRVGPPATVALVVATALMTVVMWRAAHAMGAD